MVPLPIGWSQTVGGATIQSMSKTTNSTAATTAAAVYLRLSVDTEESTSIEAQEEACRAVVTAKGWSVHDTYTDRGVSGGKAIADRPGLARLLADAEAGKVGAVVVYSIDRLARSTGVFVELADRFQKIGAPLVIVRESLDLSTDHGRMTAELLAVLASAERRLIASRVTAAHARHAADGRYYGRPAPFGWTAAPREDGPGLRLVLDEVEGPLLQEAARRVIEGEALAAVARDMGPRGLIGEDGLRRLFRKPIIAGWADLGGQTVTGEDGLPLVAHEPLLDPSERRALLAALDRRAVGPRPSGRSEEVRLLNGLDLVKCAGCGRAVAVNRQKRQRAGGEYVRTSYVCRSGCASIEAGALEAEVERQYLAAVGRFEVIESDEIADAEASEAAEALESVRERREALASMVAEGLMSPEDAREALGRLARTAADLEAVASRSNVATTETGETFAERWAAADLDERREALRSALLEVSLSKGEPGRKVTDPASRVSLVWAS